ERDEGVLGRVQGREEEGHRLEPLELVWSGHEPDRLGVERGGWQLERDRRERGAVGDRLLLVRDYLLRDRDAAEGELEPEASLDSQRLLDRRLGLLLRPGVPVAA